MTATQENRFPRLAGIATIMAMPLVLIPFAASAEDMPGADFAFDLIDPGFCVMPPAEISDADLRAIVAEQRDEIPITGEIDLPVEAGLYGDGFFARGAGRNGIATTLHMIAVPQEGQIAAICLALVPVNDMNVTEGDAALYAPESAPDTGDYYMAFARMITRDDNGEVVVLGELSGGEGGIAFGDDHGDTIFGELFLSGAMDDGEAVQFAVEFVIFEEEALRFVDLSSQ